MAKKYVKPKDTQKKAVESDEDSDGLLLADGFDDAFIGSAHCHQGSERVAVYNRDRCIEVLIQRDDMTLEDAEEFFEFNVVGAYVGPKTPLFITPNTLAEYLEFGD